VTRFAAALILFSAVRVSAQAPAALGRPVAQDFPDAYEMSERMLLSNGPDLDRDGLSDAAETELAEAFAPYLFFDSHENALEPEEPVTVFQVRPEGCAGPRARCVGKPLTVLITYLNLWKWDGGYGPASICRDRHIGDDQEIKVRAVSKDDGRTFRIDAVLNWGFEWPRKSGKVAFAGGTHPEIFFSAGKHHQFFDAALDRKPSPYSKWACRDSVDGRGAAMLSIPRGNVGEPEAHLLTGLDGLGFRGENAWGTTPFCGGQKCGPKNPTSHPADFWSKKPFWIP
jgi:hypothetical protein